MFELPTPLTEKALRGLMQDERYWKTSHPQHAAFCDRISDGFIALYGTGSAKLDETGRMINDGPSSQGEEPAS